MPTFQPANDSSTKVLERDVKRARRTYRFDVPTKPGTADVVFEASGASVPTCFYAEAL